MSTRTLVADIEYLQQKWSRAKILGFVNEGQNRLRELDCLQHHYLVPTTGFPPLLTTTAADLDYDIPDVSIDIGGTDYTVKAQRVLKVFVDVTNYSNYNLRWMGEPFIYGAYNPYSTATTKLSFSEVPVQSQELTGQNSAKITFREDQGATTDQIYTEFIIRPPQLTTVNIPLMVPERWELALMEYAIGKIEYFDLGKSERLNSFFDYWMPLYAEAMDGGAQSKDKFTPIRVS